MIAHYRPIFIIFLSLAFGIWLSKLYLYDSPWFAYTAFIIFGVMFLCILLHKKFKRVKFFEFFFKIKWHLITMIIPIIIGAGLFQITYHQQQINYMPSDTEVYGIYGEVGTNYIEKEKGVYFILENASVVTEKETSPLDFNVFVYLYYKDGVKYTQEELSQILPGNIELIQSTLSQFPVFDESEINSFAYSKGFQYSTFTYLDNITLFDGQMGFWDSIREHIRNTYKDFMGERYAGLAFSILVGDKTGLEPDIVYNFQASGIMHVIAVSGLNTAFIMMLLLFVLNRIRAKKYVKLGVVIVVLAFYALLCDMTPSVVRASLMSIFLLIGHLFGKQPDNLNSISLSGIILLLMFPLYVFDLGFLLSYAGVFGIFLLYKPLSEFLASKFKFKKLTDAIALTLSATLATTPITINAFGYISLVGLFANLILVPLFGYAFMILFGITLLTLILPFAGHLLTLAQAGFWLVDKGAYIFASIPYSAIGAFPVPDWASVGYFTSMFFASRYCVAQTKYKVILSSIGISIYFIGTWIYVINTVATLCFT